MTGKSLKNILRINGTSSCPDIRNDELFCNISHPLKSELRLFAAVMVDLKDENLYIYLYFESTKDILRDLKTTSSTSRPLTFLHFSKLRRSQKYLRYSKDDIPILFST